MLVRLIIMRLCMRRNDSRPTTSRPCILRQRMRPSLAPFVGYGYGCGYGWWRPCTNAATPSSGNGRLKHAAAMLQELGEACMSTDPKQRPTFPQILKVSGSLRRQECCAVDVQGHHTVACHYRFSMGGQPLFSRRFVLMVLRVGRTTWAAPNERLTAHV